MLNVDVIQAHMPTVTGDKENEDVEVVEIQKLRPVTGAGPGMMRISGSPKMQPSDANHLEFET